MFLNEKRKGFSLLLALRGVGRLLEFGSQVGGEDVAAEIPEKLLESVVNVFFEKNLQTLQISGATDPRIPSRWRRDASAIRLKRARH